MLEDFSPDHFSFHFAFREQAHTFLSEVQLACHASAQASARAGYCTPSCCPSMAYEIYGSSE